MKTIIHKANIRGFANHDWLTSYHSFSFASYQNVERMNFGMLRVLNDDVVAPEMGFGTHAHKNMEIISIPLKGALSHKDSMGNTRAIEVGEVQVMSAGTGLTHSEFNTSKTKAVNFLQLWIIPEQAEVTPNYEQRNFNQFKEKNKLQTVIAPKNKLQGNALPIHQQAYIYKGDIDLGTTVNLKTKANNNGFYVFIIEGSIEINSTVLNSRDAIGVWETKNLTIKANENTELIVIEVPMD